MAFLTAAGTLGTSDMFSLILPYIRGVADSSPSVRSRAVLALHRYAYLDRDRVSFISLDKSFFNFFKTSHSNSILQCTYKDDILIKLNGSNCKTYVVYMRFQIF